MEWTGLRDELVSAYTEKVGGEADEVDDLIGVAALASIPDSYLSKEDSMVRLPKRAADDEAEEQPEPKKSKKEASGEAEGTENAEVLKVFIKGLPYSVDEAALRKDFEECGEITQLQLPMNEEGRPKGFAFITFSTKEGFEAALKYDNTDYGGRYINVSKANESGKGKDGKGKGKGKDGKGGDWECPNCGDNVFARNSACRKCGTARPGGAFGGALKERDNDKTVFVRGLPFSADEDSLRKDFAECGEIVNLRLPLNEEGNPRGICFIQYTSEEGVDAALKFDNTDYGGRTIFVVKAGESKGGKGKDGKGKDGKGKGKDGKDKGKGKGKKGKGKPTSESKAKATGAMVEGTGEKKTFDDSDDD